ncbi:MAG: hypothetical protein LBP34_01065 [Flavobacteriaceae bacterium]|jgi:hypothetical protein|nr:hypothetical protein [Flavobacteriaceae bacterium]
MKEIGIKYKLLMMFPAMILAAVFYYMMTSSNYKNWQTKKDNVKAIVIKKKRDQNQHGMGYLEMSDSSQYYIFPNQYYYDIQEGDKLEKKEGSLELKVTREDSVFVIDLDANKL